MEMTSVKAVMNAKAPTLTNFFILNSRPKANNRKITPISAHVEMPVLSETDGNKSIYGPAMIPTTIYPKTNGCFIFLNKSVMIPAITRINAKSVTKAGR